MTSIIYGHTDKSTDELLCLLRAFVYVFPMTT